MSLANIVNVEILNNPCTFFDPFVFEITFEVIAPLKEDLEFKVVYVGSAENEKHDQTLESVMVGPVPVGTSKFRLEAPAPNPDSIPKNDVLGVTVVLLQVFYLNREFVRVGYYVNNDYADEQLKEQMETQMTEHPTVPLTIYFDKLQRSILADKPRVTRFSIKWDEDEAPSEFKTTSPQSEEVAMIEG
ncbi:Histone chaperone asf1 [Rhizophlyctis rosea]|uniref:Anti-silencing function protein 1 n=1 Tax=Rhizophlyctis rosea TaxID=64517 RepID=A0AAD5X664_9FUNG|nr:Histone chaperone asf1 [Rhizophlyctis rosea]